MRTSRLRGQRHRCRSMFQAVFFLPDSDRIELKGQVDSSINLPVESKMLTICGGIKHNLSISLGHLVQCIELRTRDIPMDLYIARMIPPSTRNP